jgi:hypothetical protein
MALANILVGLHRAELACPQFGASRADRLSPRHAFGKLDKQAIRELVACVVAVDVGHDHINRTCLVKRLDEFRGVTLAFESSERTHGLVAGFLRQPFSRFALIAFLQKRIHKDAVNVKGLDAALSSQVRGFTAKLGESCILRRRCAIRFRTDGQTVEIESFRKQSSVAQPNSVSSAELAVNRPDFHLEFAVVMPGPLASSASNYQVFTKPPPRFVPMAADAIEHAIFERFFGGAFAVLVPDTNNAVPVAIAHGHSLTELSVSIKRFLDSDTHNTHTRFADARSTQPDERHCEAPLRKMRKAVPNGAHASAALSSGENSRFSRGTKPLRRTTYCDLTVTLCDAANSVARTTVSRIPAQRQQYFHSDRAASYNAAHCVLFSCFSNRAATDSRDENLKAKSPAAAGGSKEERKRERLSEPTRSILDAPDDAIQSRRFSSLSWRSRRMTRKRNAFEMKSGRTTNGVL